MTTLLEAVMTTDDNFDDQVTDEQLAEAIDVLKRILEGEKVDRPKWMVEARERADRIKAAMQKQPAARDHAPAHAATAATFRVDKDDLPASQKDDQQPQPDPAATESPKYSKYSEEDMFVFTDDLGDMVRHASESFSAIKL
jgi:hypothetical protein